MDFRENFDKSVPPEEFDKWRTRYYDECFSDAIKFIIHASPLWDSVAHF